MNRVAGALGLLVAALCIGCGSGSSAGGTATLSGAITATLDVTATGNLVTSGCGVSEPSLALVFAGETSTTALTASVCTPGTSPQAGTFTTANTTTAASEYTETESGGPSLAWSQQFASGNPYAPGTFSLTLTSAGTLGTAPGGGGPTPWGEQHGTLSATLPAEPSGPASGTVTLSISF
jgi:hypothetical protein